MNLKDYYNLLVSLEKTIKLAKKAELVECASELEEMYDLINGVYCEAIEQANEVKRELDKGGQDE